MNEKNAWDSELKVWFSKTDSEVARGRRLVNVSHCCAITPKETICAPDHHFNCEGTEFPELIKELRLEAETVLSVHLIS